MAEELNIVTLNIPYPPDYGGMIDSFYRIRELSEAGVSIHLHCFEYGRSRNRILESYCTTVCYYKRSASLLDFFSNIPYIIKSRSSNELLKNLLSNNSPILFDGIHTTFFINRPEFKDRKLFLRTHNVENQYYRSLALYEKNPFTKLFFMSEVAKLCKYEKNITNTVNIFTITKTDKDFFSGFYTKVFHIPPFHPFEKLLNITGRGDYVLYHGDLSVNMNEKVVSGLIEDVFSKILIRFIIAGKDPSDKLIRKAKEFNNIKIVANPDLTEMDELIRNAHLNLLPAIGNNGFRIKLLYALFAGRFCVSNSLIPDELKENGLIHLADTPEEIISVINRLMNSVFSKEIIKKRSQFLLSHFSNKGNAVVLKKIIFGE
jgi:hypothetical protein